MPPANDYKFQEWTQAAIQFIERLPQRVTGEVESQVNLLPPLSSDALDSLASSLRLPIPAALRAFLQNASGGFEFRYKWSPTGSQAEAVGSALGGEDCLWGRGEVCKASEFAGWLADCKSWAEETWVAEYPEDLAFWTQSFPILRMGNGDFVGLDCRTTSDDPAVVYLSHDDESKIIAESFTGFLSAWARVGYVGPESWMIERFLNDDGLLDPETDKAQELQRALGNGG
jgi:hypothetical protein